LPHRQYRATFASRFELAGTVDYALHWVRRRQRALARAVLALFCLAWLQAAALPCAMAHTAAPAAAMPGEHCPYCPPADTPSVPCDDGANCAYPHQPQVDARAAAALFVAIPALQVLPAVDALARDSRAPESTRAGPVPRVPLSVSYCRFIE
jgi:hypothetical protein